MPHHVKSIHDYKSDIVRVGRMMYERRYVIAGDGNISIRLDNDTILATPTTLCKGLLSEDQIVKLDLAGNILDGEYHPSSEIKMHLAVYQTRPDILAVVHAHPPISTGFAVAGVPLDQLILAEMVINFGSIPIAPYFSPSTEELARSVAEQVRCYDAVLMANHGVITIGSDLFSAYQRLEMVEQFAAISLVAHLLGQANTFSQQQLQDLYTIREDAGIAAQNPHREHCSVPKQQPVDTDALVNTITQTVLSIIRGQ